MESNLAGDAKETLRALLPLLKRKEERSWRARIERNVEDWWRVLEAKAMQGAPEDKACRVNPQRVYWELSRRLPDDCILTCDSGSSAAWYAMDLKIRAGMKASLSGGLATMGSAVPYALAAKLTHPDRPVIALAGDGAMQMNGINELITIAEHWREWSDPCLVVVVLNNRDLNFVTWEMRGKGDRKFEASQTLPGFAYAEYARMLGLHGLQIEHADQAPVVLDAALQAQRPCVVEVLADADVPPMPAHITRQQAASYYEAIAKGDPDGAALGAAIERQQR
jgi:pyruvate dehydrogenase (quinone)